MYEKMLVPLDGSPKSVESAQHALKLASDLNGTVTLLYVVNAIHPNLNTYGDRLGGQEQIIRNHLQELGEEILNDVYERLKDMGVPLDTKLVWGNPADIICEEAKEAKYDLIVMGSRGLSQIKSYLLGSVSSRVTRHAPCPVLIVR